MNNAWEFLHISDLHLTSADDYLDDNKENVPKKYRESSLKNFLHLHATSQTLKAVANVVLSGDFTQAGGEDGFQQFAQAVLPKLRAGTSRRFFAVPGNHDVAWDLNPKSEDYFTRKFAYFQKHVQGDDLTVPLLPKDNSEDVLEFQPGNPLFVDPKGGLIVLCINSSLRCGEVDSVSRTDLARRLNAVRKELIKAKKLVLSAQVDEALGAINEMTLRDVAHVTQEQLDHLSKLLVQEHQKLGAKWDEMLRVAILHHHLMPFEHQVTEHKAFEPVSDAAQILSTLEAFDFHIIFTGHKHQSYQAHYRGAQREMLLVGGRTVCGRGDRGCKLVQVNRENGDFVVNVANLDTAFGHPNGERGVTEAVAQSKKTFYRVPAYRRPADPANLPDSSQIDVLTAERDDLRRGILKILNTEYSLEHWELTYEIGAGGRDIFDQRFEIVAKNAPVSLFLQRMSRSDGPLQWVPKLPAWDITDPDSPRDLSSCLLEKTDRSAIFAIFLEPASRRNAPRRIYTRCEREGFWVPLLEKNVDEGSIRLPRKVKKLTFCFIAPPGRKWKEFEPLSSVGKYRFEEKKTKIRWELNNLTPIHLRYRLYLQ